MTLQQICQINLTNLWVHCQVNPAHHCLLRFLVANCSAPGQSGILVQCMNLEYRGQYVTHWVLVQCALHSCHFHFLHEVECVTCPFSLWQNSEQFSRLHHGDCGRGGGGVGGGSPFHLRSFANNIQYTPGRTSLFLGKSRSRKTWQSFTFIFWNLLLFSSHHLFASASSFSFSAFNFFPAR